MTNPSFPTFHDGYLISVAVDQNRATLGFRKYNEESEYELVLDGIEALQIDDFRQGNIVYALEVITERDPRSHDNDLRFNRLFVPPHPSADVHFHEKHSSFLAERIDKIKNGEATLVTVSSSYGADVSAYCTKVTLIGPKCIDMSIPNSEGNLQNS